MRIHADSAAVVLCHDEKISTCDKSNLALTTHKKVMEAK